MKIRSSWMPWFCIFIVWATSVSHSLANPEFNGRTFSLFTTEGQPFPGTSLNLHIDDLIPVNSGLILFAAVTDDPRSNVIGGPTDYIFLLNDDGLTLVASIESEELDGIGSFRFVGLTSEQALLFQPTGSLQSYPVYKWENGSLNEFIPAGQTSADIRYLNGNVAYSMPVTTGLSTESIYYGPAGSATEIIDKDLVPNLWSYLGFDGQNVAYGVIPDGGNSTRLDIWQRASDGALSRLFSSGDTIPQEDGIAYDTGGGFFKIEDGVAYVQMTGPGGSRGGRGRPGRSDVHSIFAQIENQTPEILINTFQGVDTIGDVEIETFIVEENSRGVIRASLSLDNGDSGLFELKDGLWTQIAPALADFDGTPAIRYELIPHAEFGETIYIRVISGDPRAFPNRVYSNSDFVPPTPLSLSIEVTSATSLTLSISGESGKSIRLYRSTNLKDWQPDGDVLKLGEDDVEREIANPMESVFFQIREEVDSG